MLNVLPKFHAFTLTKLKKSLLFIFIHIRSGVGIQVVLAMAYINLKKTFLRYSSILQKEIKPVI